MSGCAVRSLVEQCWYIASWYEHEDLRPMLGKNPLAIISAVAVFPFILAVSMLNVIIGN